MAVFRRALFAPALVAFGALLASCGGGAHLIAPGAATPCPAGYAGSPGACYVTVATSSITPSAQATSAPLPSAGGITGTIALPSVTGTPAPISVTSSTTTPAGIVALQGHLRGPRSTSANTPLLYVTLTPGSDLSLDGLPGFTLILSNPLPANTPVYVAQLQGTQWVTVLGPVSVSGSSVAIPGTSQTLTLRANQPAYFAVYAGGVVTAPAASISLSLDTSSGAFAGVPATFRLTGQELNSGGNAIHGEYRTPIALTTSDTSGAVTLSAASIGSDRDVVTVTYNGAPLTTPVVITGTSATLSATATFAPNANYPLVNGATATFAQTVNSTIKDATGKTVLARTNTWQKTETLDTGVAFNGMTGLIDVHVSALRTTSGSTLPPGTDDFYMQPQFGSGQLKLFLVGEANFGYIQSYAAGVAPGTQSSTTVFHAPFPLMFAAPQTGDAYSVSATSDQNISVTYPSDLALTTEKTVTHSRADGSSDSTDQIDYKATNTSPAHSVTDTQLVNRDGSASQTDIDTIDPTHASVIEFGLPLNGFIPVTNVTKNVSDDSIVSSSVTNVPDWLPGGTMPQPLGSGTLVESTAALPAACNLQASGTDVHSEAQGIDPIYGMIFSERSDQYYVAGIGHACTTYTDTFTYYDNTTDGALANSWTYDSVETLAPEPSAAGSVKRVSRARAATGLFASDQDLLMLRAAMLAERRSVFSKVRSSLKARVPQSSQMR